MPRCSYAFIRFTIANISPGSSLLWLHFSAALVLTVFIFHTLLREYAAYDAIRHRYLLSGEPHLRTVLITNIPKHMRSRRKVAAYFRGVYSNEANPTVHLCQELHVLENLVLRRTQCLRRVERMIFEMWLEEGGGKKTDGSHLSLAKEVELLNNLNDLVQVSFGFHNLPSSIFKVSTTSHNFLLVVPRRWKLAGGRS